LHKLKSESLREKKEGIKNAVLFAVDIDGTIAGASRIFGAYFNQELGLELPQEEIKKIRWYTSLRQHPAIVAYRKENNQRFLEVCERYQEYTPAMLAREVLVGAVEGVISLAKWGAIRYFTIRISRDQQVNAQIQITTRQWLSEHGFPNSSNVAFCASFQEKLQRMVQEPHAQIILIDDRCSTDLLTCYESMMQFPEQRELVEQIRQRITFVAFRKDTLPENVYGLRMMTMPSWQHTSDLWSALQRINEFIA
jgi:hypothetical protein